jgi:hypothetical protein
MIESVHEMYVQFCPLFELYLIYTIGCDVRFVHFFCIFSSSARDRNQNPLNTELVSGSIRLLPLILRIKTKTFKIRQYNNNHQPADVSRVSSRNVIYAKRHLRKWICSTQLRCRSGFHVVYYLNVC